MEEKTLFVAAQRANGGEPLPLQAKLHLDHGALTSLMVCFPTPEVLKVVTNILEQHDILEEKEVGMYEACEQLTQNVGLDVGTLHATSLHPNPHSVFCGAGENRTLVQRSQYRTFYMLS